MKAAHNMDDFYTGWQSAFIRDRARTLVEDARVHPDTLPAAVRWLDLAETWAGKRGLEALVRTLRRAKFVIHVRAFNPYRRKPC